MSLAGDCFDNGSIFVLIGQTAGYKAGKVWFEFNAIPWSIVSTRVSIYIAANANVSAVRISDLKILTLLNYDMGVACNGDGIFTDIMPVTSANARAGTTSHYCDIRICNFDITYCASFVRVRCIGILINTTANGSGQRTAGDCTILDTGNVDAAYIADTVITTADTSTASTARRIDRAAGNGDIGHIVFDFMCWIGMRAADASCVHSTICCDIAASNRNICGAMGKAILR